MIINIKMNIKVDYLKHSFGTEQCFDVVEILLEPGPTLDLDIPE